MRLIRALAVAALSALFTLPAAAGQPADLGTPTSPVILTIHSQGTQIDLDRAMIERAGWQTIRTMTPFTDGEQEFSGIALSRLIEVVGGDGTVIEAVALNDYRVEIPAEHAEAYGVFLALDRNGEPMRIRDKGPIWVIYPHDEVLAAPERFDRFMVWQLRELSFR
ncbi:MAG: oxidoreductase [Rhodobacteraceae bacterium]|jgi:hypothetical protein|nr:oxidoreductase [Paracoccaceae bacterium]